MPAAVGPYGVSATPSEPTWTHGVLRIVRASSSDPIKQAKQLPDDAVLFDLLSDWVPDENVRHRILVENPAILYDFPRGG